ncbi:hypothetical protein [Nocardioides sp. Soil805]|uniref:hypothetical protein n=1 Tax=Nocardioides sp. Soil805 TaxID=1736416 RepID=UPI000713414F|nr:hypothetical protein [Nocardioides sp. Soil805]KRF37211.1 hypothetical protein ASG94_07655 [Nocardioides sp. Soil805]
MTEYDAGTPAPPARRFTVAADGTVSGDDGDSGRLAVSLRYACRVAGQLEFLTGAGDLEWVSTVSSTAVTARVGWSLAREVTLSAEVEGGAPRPPKEFTVVGGSDVHAALAHCMQRVRQMLGTHWGAVITGDKRVVGAAVPQSGGGVLDSMAALPEVGIRALAVLGALEERYRETCVLLDYAHGTLLVAAIGDHALYAFADKVDTRVVAEIVDEVRAVLSPDDLARADTITTGGTAADSLLGGTEPVPSPSEPAGPPPTGMRYRNVQPRQSRWGRRREQGRE